MFLEQRTRSGGLGPLPAQHVVLLGRELPLPFGVALVDLRSVLGFRQHGDDTLNTRSPQAAARSRPRGCKTYTLPRVRGTRKAVPPRSVVPVARVLLRGSPMLARFLRGRLAARHAHLDLAAANTTFEHRLLVRSRTRGNLPVLEHVGGAVPRAGDGA